MRLTSGHREAAHDADHAALGQAAREHAGEVRRLVDPVVEDAEVGVGGTATGAEDEGDLGIVGGDGAHGLLVAEGVTEDDVGGVLARRPRAATSSMSPE